MTDTARSGRGLLHKLKRPSQVPASAEHLPEVELRQDLVHLHMILPLSQRRTASAYAPDASRLFCSALREPRQQIGQQAAREGHGPVSMGGAPQDLLGQPQHLAQPPLRTAHHREQSDQRGANDNLAALDMLRSPICLQYLVGCCQIADIEVGIAEASHHNAA